MRPITMQVNYTLVNTAVPFGQLEPILDDYIPTTVIAQVCLTPAHVPVLILPFPSPYTTVFIDEQFKN